MNSATEQARYWMWTRRKPSLTNTTFTAGVGYKDSWEEQAFAEDASGRFGGCVWPPRSYSCSFCRREFRSAQALGGHMNVHRRDRARLKQSPTQTIQQNSAVLSSSSTFEQYEPDHRQSPHLYPNQLCPIMLYSNSNPNFSLRGVERNLHSTTKEDCSCDQAASSLLVSPSNNSSSAIGAGRRKRSLLLQADENLKIGEIYLDDRINKENSSNEEEDEDDIVDTNSFKKLRTYEAKSSRGEGLTSGDLRLGCQVFYHNPIEELDLELRLGDRPKDDVL